jgi:hypothetical protein
MFYYESDHCLLERDVMHCDKSPNQCAIFPPFAIACPRSQRCNVLTVRNRDREQISFPSVHLVTKTETFSETHQIVTFCSTVHSYGVNFDFYHKKGLFLVSFSTGYERFQCNLQQ